MSKMESNFSMFQSEWAEFYQLGRDAESLVHRSPGATLVKMRLLAEELAKVIAQYEGYSKTFKNQNDRLQTFLKDGVLEDDVFLRFDVIRKRGNLVSHDVASATSVTADIAMKSLKGAHYIGAWFLACYRSFDFEKVEFQEPVDMDLVTQQEIEQLKAKNEILLAQLNERAFETHTPSQKEFRKTTSKNFVKKHPTSEDETREWIDQQLRDAGWEADSVNLNYKLKRTVPQKGRNIAIAEYRCGNGWADYVLFSGLIPVGVVEAKKYGKDVAGDLTQAKNYARSIEYSEFAVIPTEYEEYRIPFIYATNGRPYLKQLKEKSGVWFWDARSPYEHSYPLERWHSPSDLIQKLEVNEIASNKKLEALPYPEFAKRDYQIAAIKAVESALEDNQRRMMLAMATGTGKTRTALAIMHRLLESKSMRRILFLVDRKSLGEQAADALKDTKIGTYSMNDIYNVKEVTDAMVDKADKIYIATVQGMVKRLFFQEDNSKIPSVGTYDFIIVDEAHRGYTEDREMTEDELFYNNEKDYVSQYRRVIDYFDATVLALTATPALHTTNIFGEPIHTYNYTDAVVDGYLVDNEPPYKFETQLMQSGIKFEKNAEVQAWDEETKDIEIFALPDEINYDVEGFNKQVITPEFNRAILKELTNYIDPESEEKTLIFAATDNHADMIVRILKEAYTESGFDVHEDAILKITGAINKPSESIKKFKNEQYPNIVVTVDLLTTGIDVPKISNLVFLRRVKSRILYEQMLGRATRLCPEIEKESFKIFDAVRLYDFLDTVSTMKPVSKNLKKSIREVFETVLASKDEKEFEFHKEELIAKIQRKKQRLKDKDVRDLSELNQINSLDQWVHSLKNMNRDEFENQQEKIYRYADYALPKKKTLIYEGGDEITSVERGYGEGNVKPEDYLASFDKFIKENVNEFTALNILVNRPKDLTSKDLREIERKLKEQKFDQAGLQQAWRNVKNEKVTADIISFIRQAALGDALIDPKTRIEKAMKKIHDMAEWTPLQIKWLDRIEKQLLANAILAPTAQEYFDNNTSFKEMGGYKRYSATFKDHADEIVDIINENLYA